MSFNLNKNEGSADASKKSTFDLSKSDQEILAQPAKSHMGWYTLIALMVIGALIWYFTRPEGVVSEPRKVVTENTTVADTTQPVTVASPQAIASNVSSDAPVLAASFNAGSVAPQIEEDLLAITKSKVKAGLKIYVQGYASSEGPYSVNQNISQARADAYKSFLVKNGIPADSIIAVGKGIASPIAANDSEAGRAKNRRVEVLFH
ncbi:OmpA family protein [Mucilaginibacter calamicampi]|uniref:OmpA family protein n=1 Tax=Mucilaginibacter calamicampi TaxID=1302352 RepID=A0ABW2YS21_9SPHI